MFAPASKIIRIFILRVGLSMSFVVVPDDYIIKVIFFKKTNFFFGV